MGQENVQCGPGDAVTGGGKGRKMANLPPVPRRALGGKGASSLLNAGPSAKRPHLVSFPHDALMWHQDTTRLSYLTCPAGLTHTQQTCMPGRE